MCFLPFEDFVFSLVSLGHLFHMITNICSYIVSSKFELSYFPVYLNLFPFIFLEMTLKCFTYLT